MATPEQIATFAQIVYGHLFELGYARYITWTDIANYYPGIAEKIKAVLPGGTISTSELVEKTFQPRNWTEELGKFWTGTQWEYDEFWVRNHSSRTIMLPIDFVQILLKVIREVEAREIRELGVKILDSATNTANLKDEELLALSFEQRLALKAKKQLNETSKARLRDLQVTLKEAKEYVKRYLCFCYVNDRNLVADLKTYCYKVPR